MEDVEAEESRWRRRRSRQIRDLPEEGGGWRKAVAEEEVTG